MAEGEQQPAGGRQTRTVDLGDLALSRIVVALGIFLLIALFNPLGVKQNSESATQDFFETVFAAVLPPAAITTPEEAYQHIRAHAGPMHVDHPEAEARAEMFVRRVLPTKFIQTERGGDGNAAPPPTVASVLAEERRLRREEPLSAHPWAPIHVLRFDDVVLGRIHPDDPDRPRRFARHQLPVDRLNGLFFALSRLKVSVIFLDIRLLTDTSKDGRFCGADGVTGSPWQAATRRPLRRGEANTQPGRAGDLETQERMRSEEKPFLFIAGLPTNHVLNGKKAATGELAGKIDRLTVQYFRSGDPGERGDIWRRIARLLEVGMRMQDAPVRLPERLACLHDVARVIPVRWSTDDYPLGIPFGDSNHETRTVRLLGGPGEDAPDPMPTPIPALEVLAAWCAHPLSVIQEFPVCHPRRKPSCPSGDCVLPEPEAYAGVEIAARRWADARLARAAETAGWTERRLRESADRMDRAEEGLARAVGNRTSAVRALAVAERQMRLSRDAIHGWQMEDAGRNVGEAVAATVAAEEELAASQAQLAQARQANLVPAIRLHLAKSRAMRMAASDDPASISADIPVASLHRMEALGLRLDPRLDPWRNSGWLRDLWQGGVRVARGLSNAIDGTEGIEQPRLSPRPHARSPELYQWLMSDVNRRFDSKGDVIPDMTDIHGCRPEATFIDSRRVQGVAGLLDHVAYAGGRVRDELLGNVAGTENAFARGCSNIPVHPAFLTYGDWPGATTSRDPVQANRTTTFTPRAWDSYMKKAFHGSAVIIAGNFDNARDVVPSTVFGDKLGALVHAEALQCLLWYGPDCPRRPERLLFDLDMMDLLELLTLVVVLLMSRRIVRMAQDAGMAAGGGHPARRFLGLQVRRDYAPGYRLALLICIPIVIAVTGLGLALLPYPSADLLALILILGVVFREGVVGMVQAVLWHLAGPAREVAADHPDA